MQAGLLLAVFPDGVRVSSIQQRHLIKPELVDGGSGDLARGSRPQGRTYRRSRSGAVQAHRASSYLLHSDPPAALFRRGDNRNVVLQRLGENCCPFVDAKDTYCFGAQFAGASLKGRRLGTFFRVQLSVELFCRRPFGVYSNGGRLRGYGVSEPAE